MLTDISTIAGLMCIGLATPPTIFAVGMLVSGGVGKRASKQKPFA